MDVYNDFDFRDQSADDDSQGDDEEGSSWVHHTRDDPRESFVTRDNEKVSLTKKNSPLKTRFSLCKFHGLVQGEKAPVHIGPMIPAPSNTIF